MHAVYILCDDPATRVLALYPGNYFMSDMRVAFENLRPSQFMKIEHLFRINIKSILAGVFFPTVFMPDPTGATIGRDPGFGRHACTGKKDDGGIIIRI